MSSHGYRSRFSRVAARRRVLVVAVALLAALILVAGFYLGQLAAYSGMGIDPELYRQLRADQPEKEQRLQELDNELATLESRNEVDRAALELLRSDLADQKREIGDLEEGLRFYRGLMAPGELAQGLSLRTPELVALNGEGRFAFRIVAQQEARKHETLRGTLYAEIFGLLEGEQVTYSLAELSDDFDKDVIPLRFRYFQAIEGEVSLPAGFDPRFINVTASATSPRKAEAREQYPWQTKEKFTHVGK
ncbi:MAG: DUF6776 family protein [Halieaceae bacterium]